MTHAQPSNSSYTRQRRPGPGTVSQAAASSTNTFAFENTFSPPSLAQSQARPQRHTRFQPAWPAFDNGVPTLPHAANSLNSVPSDIPNPIPWVSLQPNGPAQHPEFRGTSVSQAHPLSRSAHAIPHQSVSNTASIPPYDASSSFPPHAYQPASQVHPQYLADPMSARAIPTNMDFGNAAAGEYETNFYPDPSSGVNNQMGEVSMFNFYPSNFAPLSPVPEIPEVPIASPASRPSMDVQESIELFRPSHEIEMADAVATTPSQIPPEQRVESSDRKGKRKARDSTPRHNPRKREQRTPTLDSLDGSDGEDEESPLTYRQKRNGVESDSRRRLRIATDSHVQFATRVQHEFPHLCVTKKFKGRADALDRGYQISQLTYSSHRTLGQISDCIGQLPLNASDKDKLAAFSKVQALLIAHGRSVQTVGTAYQATSEKTIPDSLPQQREILQPVHEHLQATNSL
ncbi:hypothetical protein SISNIDRAFT_486291 [Sistotremastrum niveocremeum HHB9708]|uniref:Uncharacterized protein n=1 Tax=Sistotremastrum niveocremeum HHB9708 TaxID=1314777 RepID=A0A164U043_9AGAM|nr:hypothetical protein SISNIDRAFT_486291 [Sistotremastrum niveocremeum HHB9708]